MEHRKITSKILKEVIIDQTSLQPVYNQSYPRLWEHSGRWGGKTVRAKGVSESLDSGHGMTIAPMIS